jgi:glycerol-3-phosphate dehydrogenase
VNRSNEINRLKNSPDKVWDMLVIGGGATGLGVLVDAATRGYEVAGLEQHDFAKGTSGRSTKLVHGGVRYLAQGDISLVLEALHERGLMYQNAPHLVHNQGFIIPTYTWWRGPFYTLGLKVYDMMAGKLGLGPSRSLDKEEVIEALPTIQQEGLTGGVRYFDGQFDDARMAISLAQTAVDNGACLVNYCQVTGLLKSGEFISGVEVRDLLHNETFTLKARVVINATGVFADSVLQMDNPKARPAIRPSQGIHLVLEEDFLKGNTAIMIPQTEDGRVLFAVPWHGKVVVGTTDTAVSTPTLEPRALKEEVDFILRTAARYLSRPPKKEDIRSIFAGLRPLAAPKEGETQTKEISRGHKITVSPSGLVTILGGKWTTFRKMAEETVEKAAMVALLPKRPCVTENLPIHGYLRNTKKNKHFSVYGSDYTHIKALGEENPDWKKVLHERLPYTAAEVIWATRYEMAQTVEDVLSRRMRALLLDARAAMEMAPAVASLMSKELKKPRSWQKEQIKQFLTLAEHYLPENPSTSP